MTAAMTQSWHLKPAKGLGALVGTVTIFSPSTVQSTTVRVPPDVCAATTAGIIT